MCNNIENTFRLRITAILLDMARNWGGGKGFTKREREREREREKGLTFRRLMSYIYIYIYIYIYMEHPFLMFLDRTQRRSTVGRTPLDE